MLPVSYELGFYIPEDGILRHENLKSYTSLLAHNVTLWFSEVLTHNPLANSVREERLTTIAFQCHRSFVGRIRLLFKYAVLVTCEEWRLLECYAGGSCKNRRFGVT
jgi:hypothetical protein